MSESKTVRVEGLSADNATLLLAAAKKLDVPIGEVKTTSFGWFEVPEEVAKEAGLDVMTQEVDQDDEYESEVDPDAYTKDELVAKAKRAGVDTSGTKAEIAERLNKKE